MVSTLFTVNLTWARHLRVTHTRIGLGGLGAILVDSGVFNQLVRLGTLGVVSKNRRGMVWWIVEERQMRRHEH